MDKPLPTVYVTGASGFIGRHVVRDVAKQGYTTIAAARRRGPNIDAYLRDCTIDPSDLCQGLRLPQDVMTIVHVAAVMPHNVTQPGRVREGNLQMMRNIIKELPSRDNLHVIYMSTMGVYNNPKLDRIDEDTPVSLINEYSEGKYGAELLLEEAVRKGKCRGTIIRLPAVVGAGSHHNFPSNLVQQLSNREQITLYNRHYRYNHIIHIDLLTQFLLTLLGDNGRTFSRILLGSEEPITIAEFVMYLARKLGVEPELCDKESDRGCPVIILDRAKNIGFKPVSVLETLDCYVQDILTTGLHDPRSHEI